MGYFIVGVSFFVGTKTMRAGLMCFVRNTFLHYNTTNTATMKILQDLNPKFEVSYKLA
jgi:hypothetical protein